MRELKVVAINDLATPIQCAFDSFRYVHGRFRGDVRVDGDSMVVTAIASACGAARSVQAALGELAWISCWSARPVHEQGEGIRAHRGGAKKS